MKRGVANIVGKRIEKVNEFIENGQTTQIALELEGGGRIVFFGVLDLEGQDDGFAFVDSQYTAP